ncbi:GNAT family N-acetyltransferase [Longispora albida]|uniref:GNAT family N-acetyltransferase n=1 Tax=Longispora albida TaxID=203523 RepID=UPI00035DDB3A|nr:GNAT family N-acetyltransferase [Longispora albida]
MSTDTLSATTTAAEPARTQIRQLTSPAEIDLFLQLPYVLNHELADDLEVGRRRPEWMWIAERAGKVVGRIGFWSAPGAAEPAMLDIFDVDPAHRDLTGELLAAALPAGDLRPDYVRFVSPGWREDPDEYATVSALMSALERTGARLLVERLRLTFSSLTEVPPESGRLSYRVAGGREELIPLMEEVLEGTLDAYSTMDMQVMTPRETAESHFDQEFARYASPREWWEVATLPSGEPVGFVIPARNPYNHIIAYIAVLPAHRGQGYVADLLARGTRTLVEAGAPRVRAATDLGNVPMAQAFERAGYSVFERALTMTWSPDA